MVRADSKLTPAADGAKGERGVDAGEAGQAPGAQPGDEDPLAVARDHHVGTRLGGGRREPGERAVAGDELAPVQERGRGHRGAQLAQIGERGLGAQRDVHHRPPEYAPMPLQRLAWLITVGVMLIVALLLFLEGYSGYAGVSLAVAASAAINLF